MFLRKHSWILILFALCCHQLPAHSQRLTEAEKKAIVTRSGDLKATFDLITALHRAQRAQEAATVYRQLWQASPDAPRLKAQYAFASLVASDYFAVEIDTSRQKRLRSELMGQWSEVLQCREQSAPRLENDAGALLMNAVYYERTGEFGKSVELAEKASTLQPKWAFARFWLAGSREQQAGKISTNNPKDMSLPKQIWQKALTDCKRAEQIDPDFAANNDNLLVVYTTIYRRLGQNEKALEYMNRLIKSLEAKKPTRRNQLTGLREWRQLIKKDVVQGNAGK